jgi:hypothetical protein
VTVAACVCSIFGMNLDSGIESDPYAFYLTILFVIVTRLKGYAHYCATMLPVFANLSMFEQGSTL